MDTEQYAGMVDELLRRHREDIEALADKVRREVVVPTCKEHGLQFYSGMGTFYFLHGDKMYGYADDHMSAKLRKALIPVFNLLNTELTRGDYLGYYIRDYKG